MTLRFNTKRKDCGPQKALWPFLVCFCSGPVHLAHLAPAPGAHDYTIDPLTGWASSVQPIHLRALQLSEPSQPRGCEWQLVQHCNLSGNEIPTATSYSRRSPYKSPWSWRAGRCWQGCERAQLASESTLAQLSLAAKSTKPQLYPSAWDLRVGLTCQVGNLRLHRHIMYFSKAEMW